MTRALLFGSLVVVLACCAASVDRVAAEQDDAASFGHPDSVLFWSPEQQLAGFRNYDRIFHTSVVEAGDAPSPLPSRPHDFGGLRYEVEGEVFDLAGFTRHNHVAGLLVIREGVAVLEQYGLGNGPETKWVSYSVAKSVVSMLMGAAIEDRYISGVDALVTDFLPVLRGTSYEGVTIRDALRMASGVAWNEDYTDPSADVSLEIPLTMLERLEFLGSHPRVAPPGARFNYNTGETNLVGAIVRSAVGSNLSTYLSARIWRPFGMEADGNWMLVEPDGAEHGGCCLSATLRDYGRIGLFALGGGVLPDGTRVLPEGWMEESTTPSPGFDGYGYLWWLGEGRTYRASGIFGQAIHVDPGEGLVVVTHSVWPTPTGDDLAAHRAAFFEAVTRYLSN
jgi:CubicO group peptidase (beta-lactamase class C family)